MTDTAAAPRFAFLGGELCLDFANTADWHRADEPGDRLRSYADLAAWGREAGLLDPAQERALLAAAGRRPAEAEGALNQARALREAIFSIFGALAGRLAPKAADLDALNRAVARSLGQARVVATPGGGFAWGWDPEPGALDRMLWPVARSAADLLTSARLGNVRMCADDLCGWLFLDTTRNRSRRWCRMEDCGNRNKARRFYRRKRAGD